MLSLRIARGSRPTVLLRRLLVAASSAGVGFLLLAALGYALGHPGRPIATLVRLTWCVVPFAATVHLSVVVARTEPSGRLHAGLAAAGLGHGRLPLLAAATTALSCALGSTVALLVFLHLRGDIKGLPSSGAAAALLGADRPLPAAGALTLLAAVPLLGAIASAISLRPRRPLPAPADEAKAGSPGATSAVTIPAGPPWGVALTVIGLATEVSARALALHSPATSLPLPGAIGAIAPAVLAGWALTTAGMMLAAPGLVHACGRLLAAHRPGALRLIAGRALQQEAHHLGRPLGVLCAIASAACAGTELYGTEAHRLGPLTGLTIALVAVSATATALTSAVEAKRAHRHTTATLSQLGTSTAMLRGAVALRTALLLLVAAPLTWVVAELAALPLVL